MDKFVKKRKLNEENNQKPIVEIIEISNFTFKENEIYNMDCIEGMKLIPKGKIDLIVTDPPFAIEFHKKKSQYNRNSSNVLEGYQEISSKDYPEFTYKWLIEAYRILKETGSMYIFSGWTNLKDILVALDKIGFITVNHIIWKYQFGVFTKKKFVTSHYHVLFVCKNDSKRKFYSSSRFGKETKNEKGGSKRYEDMEDVWIIKREYWKNKVKTPTKLPTEIIKKCLDYSSVRGDFVFDPFLGSGQVAVTARDMGRKFGGFELCKNYFDFAKERLLNNEQEDEEDEKNQEDEEDEKNGGEGEEDEDFE